MGLETSPREVAQRVKELRHRAPRDLVAAVRDRMSYTNDSFGLRRDLTLPFEPPEPRIPLRIRPLEDRDVADIIDPATPGLTDEERAERRPRLAMLKAGLETAYVAVNDEDAPTYVQWLISPAQNDLVQQHFKGTFPVLEADQALLEGAFTPVAHRGKRIMPFAMARIAEKGVDLGARYVFTFVSQDNAASLAGCTRSGFAPYLSRRIHTHAMRQTVTFGPLPDAVQLP